MKRLLLILALFTGLAYGQGGNTVTIRFAGAPTGTCSPVAYAVNNSNGDFYDCLSGAWHLVSGGGGSGTVTSVAQTFTGGLISVSGSPITTSGTLALTVAGTSGGIPYFSSASTWASSAALTANQLVLGGGAGATPATLGSLGTTTTLLHGNAGGAPTFSTVSLTADVSGVLPAANGGIANVSVADQGYMFGGFPGGLTTVTNATIVSAANQTRAIQFVLPYQITITKITWDVAAGAGDTVSFGIYSADRSTKLVDSGATVTAGTIQSVTIGSVTLPAGVYWFAWTQTGTPTTTLVNWNNVNRDLYLNGNTAKKVGTGTASTAGALPGSLGTISAATITSFPMVVFEP